MATERTAARPRSGEPAEETGTGQQKTSATNPGKKSRDERK